MSNARERQVNAYLKPKHIGLFTAYVEVNEISKSEGVNIMVKNFFDKMPESERRALLNKRESKNGY